MIPVVQVLGSEWHGTRRYIFCLVISMQSSIPGVDDDMITRRKLSIITILHASNKRLYVVFHRLLSMDM